MSSTARQLFVRGTWIETAAKEPVSSPFDGRTVGEVCIGSADTIKAAIDAAAEAFPSVRRQPAHVRSALLERIARGIEDRSEEFAQLIVAEAGKPIKYARTEVARAVMTFATAAAEVRRPEGEMLALDALPPGEGHTGWVRRFPVGVISAITPFNFPLNLVAHKVAPALATGNTMVVKPAPKTPLTALMLAEVLADSGVPAGQVNVVTCSNTDAPLLVSDPRVQMISFTGSPAVGWKLKERSGSRRITLELGGNAGCIVAASADLDSAVPLIGLGAFAQAGQSCISVQRIFVDDSRYDEFREAFIRWTSANAKTGDPSDPESIVGPMIDRGALQRIVSWVEEALCEGARVTFGGRVEGSFLHPTILEDVSPRSKVCTEEAFAPIVTLHRVANFAAALAQANDSRFGLQAGVFTADLNEAFLAFEELEVGGVMINQVPTYRVESMPYGGVKESGFGREGVRSAMESMTEPRCIVLRMGK